MIEPIDKLVFSMHANKGVYALFLGSGVSKSAGILTGWEVMIDLVKTLAHVKEKKNLSTDDAAIEWFRANYDGSEPSYSILLEQLGKSKAERQGILKPYFEREGSEVDKAIEKSRSAQTAIAELVLRGYVKIIITTNFDRLIEKALESKGITPNIIYHDEQIRGMLPLVHSKITIVKINGDYVDTRMKNTVEELSGYDKNMRKLILEIFENYGLIFSGWSAKYDGAILSMLLSRKNRRYSSYWGCLKKPEAGSEASHLIEHLQAETVIFENANALFCTLEDKVCAIEDFTSAPPQSVSLIESLAKKYIQEQPPKIRLGDLIEEQLLRIQKAILRIDFTANLDNNPEDWKTVQKKVVECESLVTEILVIIKVLTKWGSQEDLLSFFNALHDLIQSDTLYSDPRDLNHLRKYPIILLLYQTVVGLVINRREEYIYNLQKIHKRFNGIKNKVFWEFQPFGILDKSIAKYALPDSLRLRMPLDERVLQILFTYWNEFYEFELFEEIFDRVQLLIAIYTSEEVADLRYEELRKRAIGAIPWGRYIFRTSGRFYAANPEFWNELKSEFNDTNYSKLTSTGFCNGDRSKINVIVAEIEKTTKDRVKYVSSF